jgi:hypothetical protein
MAPFQKRKWEEEVNHKFPPRPPAADAAGRGERKSKATEIKKLAAELEKKSLGQISYKTDINSENEELQQIAEFLVYKLFPLPARRLFIFGCVRL